ncbi:MAG: hypothetical protein U5R31_12060 [Acidimicrobiia bacterium]|nr:hypothetical protein [Acidimicrobiia bacterium]
MVLHRRPQPARPRGPRSGVGARAGAHPARLPARRSVTSEVPLLLDDADPDGHAVIGFARVPRRETDREKPDIDLAEAAAAWREIPLIDSPLRDAVGVEAIEPATGTVRVALREELLNPAGALQGAMVTLLAEAAAEDLAEIHLGGPQVVTDLDIRFLTQAREGPVSSQARFVGPPGDGSVVVELLDEGNRGRVVASVLARTRSWPGLSSRSAGLRWR